MKCKELNQLISNKAELIITTKDDVSPFSEVEYMIKDFTHPKISAPLLEYKTDGGDLSINSNVLEFEDFKFNFYIDSEYINYNAIENYIYEVNDSANFMSKTFEVIIVIYNSDNELIKKSTLCNCMFKSLGGNKVDYTEQTNKPMWTECSLTYSHVKNDKNINYY